MDTLTHLTLGACLGEAFAGRKLGKQAMAWGVIAHCLPDIDVIAALWLSTPSALLAHRGITHSFLFCILIVPLLALLAYRLSYSTRISWLSWLCFFGTVILLHDMLDALNNYGVGWFEPFSQQRISLNVIYVADPFLTIWPFGASLGLLFIQKSSIKRKIWRNAGLGMATLYLLYCATHKMVINYTVHTQLKKQNISYSRYLSTPAPLQNWLWYVVAGTNNGYYTAYLSVFDHQKPLKLHYFPRNRALLDRAKDKASVSKLIRFSQQFYTVEMHKDTLVFNDLRFGQVIGWKNPAAPFAFYYFPDYPSQNKMVVQRGRLAGWNWGAISSLYQRIRGE